MKKFSCILLLLLPTCFRAQELILQGRVVDAETGDFLPYATISVGKGRGTLTNTEGYFRLKASSGDEVTFSFVGFEKYSMEAQDIPSTVKLKPFKRVLPEVMIKPRGESDVIRYVIRNLKRDFSRHRKERQAYFLRSLMNNGSDSYLIECFTAWSSSVNLRDEEVFSGIYGMNVEGERSKVKLTYTNIDRMAEVSPSAFKSNYWSKAIKPLNSISETMKYYNVEIDVLYNDAGENLYCIKFHWNNRMTEKGKWRRYITGTAFVDRNTLHLLRFEGEVNNAYQWVDDKRLPTSIKFQMSYDYSKGYASVGSLAVQGGNDEMSYRMLLFGIPADSLLMTSGGFVGKNIIDELKYAGYDESLWEEYNIVKRTREEEAVAFTQ